MKMLFCLIALLLPVSATAEIYKWVDENGNVHFGDEPPELKATEKVEVNTEKLGVRLSHDGSEQTGSVSTATPEVTESRPAVTIPATETEVVCENDRDSCFTLAEDQVCLLRWGLHCNDVYFWSLCEKQSCENRKSRETCAKAFYYLNNRHKAVNSRDQGRPFPTRANVNKRDWQCLLETGLFCDEYSDAGRCEAEYGLGCEGVAAWVNNAVQKCQQTKGVDCEFMDVILRYRPLNKEEKLRLRPLASGGVGSWDVLMEKHGFRTIDAVADAKVRSVLRELPMAMPTQKTRFSLSCDRRIEKRRLLIQ